MRRAPEVIRAEVQQGYRDQIASIRDELAAIAAALPTTRQAEAPAYYLKTPLGGLVERLDRVLGRGSSGPVPGSLPPQDPAYLLANLPQATVDRALRNVMVRDAEETRGVAPAGERLKGHGHWRWMTPTELKEADRRISGMQSVAGLRFDTSDGATLPWTVVIDDYGDLWSWMGDSSPDMLPPYVALALFRARMGLYGALSMMGGLL